MLNVSRTDSLPRSSIFLTSITLVIFCGSSLPTLLFSPPHTSFAAGITIADQQHFDAIMDADESVEGRPTVSAETIDKIFVELGSPMAGTGTLIERTAYATHIDDAFALAVWWAETNDGEAGVGLTDRNPGSVRGNTGFPVAYDGYTVYSSYALAIVDWFHLLRTNYLNRGFTTVYEICHPYVATASAGDWAAKVIYQIARYRLEGPPASAQALTMTTGGARPLRTMTIGGPLPLLTMGVHYRYRALRPDRSISSAHHAAIQREQMKRDQNDHVTRADSGKAYQVDAQHQPIITWTQAQAGQLGLVILLTSTFAILAWQIRRRRKTPAQSITVTIGITKVPPTPALIQMTPQAVSGPIPLTPYMPAFSGDETVYPYKRIVDTEGIPQQKRMPANLQ